MVNLSEHQRTAKPYESLPIAQRRTQLLAAATCPLSTSDQRLKAVDVLCRLLLMRRRRGGPHRQGQARRNQ